MDFSFFVRLKVLVNILEVNDGVFSLFSILGDAIFSISGFVNESFRDLLKESVRVLESESVRGLEKESLRVDDLLVRLEMSGLSWIFGPDTDEIEGLVQLNILRSRVGVAGIEGKIKKIVKLSGSAAVQNRPCTALNCTALQQYCTALQFSSTSYLVKIQKHYP